MSLTATATRVLEAMATSDVEAVRALCAPDVVVYGTDRDERWSDVGSLAIALDGMRALGLEARWQRPPVSGPGWVAGLAEYRGDGIAPMLVRVTMMFAGDRLVHGHFSLEAAAPA